MPACKFCKSEQVVKSGNKSGVQRYLCKNCGHKFYDNNVNFPRMRVNDHAIVTALSLYYDGLSSWKISKQLSDIFGEEISHTTVLKWIRKYTTLATDYVRKLEGNLQLSGKYHHDETEIKVGGEGRYFWETIDEDTRYIVAHLLTESRTSEHTKEVFKQALEKQRPNALFTDGSFAYDDAYNKVYYSRFKANKVEWVRRVGIQARETNNIVERLHGTLKDRLRPMRGLKHDNTAKTLLDGYVINYNYCRKHSSIGMTPAQAAGVTEVKGWKQLIESAQVQKTQQEIQEKELVQEVRN